MKVDGVSAEFVNLGGVKMADPSGYRVIVDRISQDIPFYRAYLKNASLTGTIVINNPFGGRPTTNSSITHSRANWGSPFHRPSSCLIISIRQEPPINRCGT